MASVERTAETELSVLALDRRRASARNDLRLYGGAVDDILTRRRAGDGPRLIVTPNLDHWRLLSHSRAFRRAYDAAAIVLNDSRFLSKSVFGRDTLTVPGSELVLMMLAAAPAGAKVLVIGCPPAVADFLARSRPDLTFQSVEPSQGFIFMRAERRALAALAAASRPDRILVCTGAPRSEVMAHQLVRALDHACDILCCGAGLQFAAGLKARAPAWMRRLGAEWLWRLTLERHTRGRYLMDALYLVSQRRALGRLKRERRTRLGRLEVSRP